MSDVRLTGKLGTYFLPTGVTSTKKISMIQINTDAVLGTLTETRLPKGNNSTTSYTPETADALTDQNLAGRTVSKGMLLTARGGWYFSVIDFDSGDGIGTISED